MTNSSNVLFDALRPSYKTSKVIRSKLANKIELYSQLNNKTKERLALDAMQQRVLYEHCNKVALTQMDKYVTIINKQESQIERYSFV